MATKAQDDRESETDIAVEPGYAEWKMQKIEIGRAQAKDRSCMIPAENIWHELNLEG